MVTRQELKELASHMLTDAYYISLFLDVDPKNNPKDEWLLHFKNLSKDTMAALPAVARANIKGDMDKIEKFLADKPHGMKRGLVIFSCGSRNFWKVYNLAVPFENQLIVEHDPFIKPLITMLDLHQRYLVVHVEGTRARFFLIGSGEIEELKSIAKQAFDVDKTRDGGTGDMGEVRAQKQKERSQQMFFKEVIPALEKAVRIEDIERIILIGSETTRSKFKSALSDDLREKVVGDLAVDKNANKAEILELCVPAMKQIEYDFERKALDELFNRGNDGSVLGLSDVLTSLQQGNIHKLYVMSDIVQPGMVCQKCGALTPELNGPCPYCGGKMKHVLHMLDLTIQKALDQGARIDMLDEAPRLEKAGGIGALLRY